MAGKIISLINFKGGVGKTTLSVNVAACVAHEHSKRTLLIDLDPQSNSSNWLLGEAKWQNIAKKENISKTTYHLFTGKFNPDTVIAPYNDEKGASLSNLFLLPATYHMVKLESGILRYCDNRRVREEYRKGDEFRFFSNDVKTLRREFDYVFIDCPPNLYYGTGNALCNSDFVLVPVIPDKLSTIGLQLLLRELTGMVSPLIDSSSVPKAPVLLGVVLSKLKPGVNEHRNGIKSARKVVNLLKEKGNILVNERTRVYEDQPVREYIAHAQAMQNHLPLCLFDDGCQAYKDVSALTYAVIQDAEA